MEARAERALRRGELAEALGLFEQLAQSFPSEEGLARKLHLLRESLQPQELQHLQNRLREPANLTLGPSSPMQEGERLFVLGDYVGAAAAYRRALQERPGNELILERLGELYRLARELPVQSPTDKALPEDPAAKLQALLDRLASRRRLKRG
jgi:tetratricopeptide (TPR) repeat protein